MVQAFRDLGHEVDVVALVEADLTSGTKVRRKGWKALVNYSPKWLYELMRLAYNLYGYILLARKVRAKKPDFIYERYSLNTFCGIWASQRFNMPLILEVNAPLSYEESVLGNLVFRRLARLSEKWICSNSTWTIVVSGVMRELFVREGVPAKKLVVMPNGVDLQQFHQDMSRDTVRQRYSLNGKSVIGFVGWFRPWHGLEMLLSIFHEHKLAEKGARLLLVGDGPSYSDIYRYAEKYDLLSAVIFTGAVKRQKIADYVGAMDIAVQPSAPEYACPMKLFEYMGAAKCIVAPDQPNIREILTNDVNSFLFRPGDRDELAAVLLKALSDPSRREILGIRAYSTIYERQFLWSANAKKVLQLAFSHDPTTRS
jgi:glycosyltransferase involved in cell wall biosynthesis